MQAITTKFLPCTNTKPSRIKATCERGSVTISVDQIDSVLDLMGVRTDEDFRHRQAARFLLSKFLDEDALKYGSKKESNPWAREFVTGCTNGNFVHVFLPQK